LAALGQMVIQINKDIREGNIPELPISPVTATATDKNDNPENKAEEDSRLSGTDGNDSSSNDSKAKDSKAMLPKIRDSVLDMIVERTHDVSPYTRASVMKVWHSLLVAGAVRTNTVTWNIYTYIYFI
tara:strand:+ start:163 stop:543 length:381 start_codon:yes stop_codon:yes gene_type:complete